MDKQNYNLQLYKSKNGFRWRFYIDGNIKCVGTDPSNTMKEAFEDAKVIIGTSWDVGEYIEEDN